MQVTDIVTTAATVGLLLVTGIYAWLTHRLAKSAESQIWETARPRVVASVRAAQSGQIFDLVIENIGASVAYDLELALDRDVFQSEVGDRNIRELAPFSGKIPTFVPNIPIAFHLGVTFRYMRDDVDRAKHPTQFTVTARYRSEGRMIEDCFPIDIIQQYGSTAREIDAVHDFATNFPKQFKNSMEALTRVLSTPDAKR